MIEYRTKRYVKLCMGLNRGPIRPESVAILSPDGSALPGSTLEAEALSGADSYIDKGMDPACSLSNRLGGCISHSHSVPQKMVTMGRFGSPGFAGPGIQVEYPSMEFDPRAPEFRADPYPFYDMLRSFAPVFYWEPWGVWFLTRHEDCQTLLRDDRLGHSFVGEAPPQQQALWDMQRNWILSMNPPDHTRLRSLVYRAFTPRTVAQLRGTIQQTTDDLIEEAMGQGEMDIIRDFAYPLPVTVICSMLGIPAEDHVRFHQWSDAIARSLDLIEEEAVYDRASAAAEAITVYLADLIAERRANPQDDLLSSLVAVEEAGDRLSAEELYATCALLLIAGHETTVNLLGNGTLALLRNRDQWERLQREPQLAKTAIEELLRYDSPVQFTSRIALEDFVFHETEFPAGTAVGFVLGSANRDPEQFEDPWRLDIGREQNKHLAFGGGIHYCLGAPLARLEGEIAFTTLARRLPKLALASDTVLYKDNYVLRGLESLPVTF